MDVNSTLVIEMIRTNLVLIAGLIMWTLILSAFAQTRISFEHTESFPHGGEKTGLMHDVEWSLELAFDFYFPVGITAEMNVTEVEPNDYVEVNATATAPENEAYCKITVNGELNISGPQVNRQLWIIQKTVDKYFTTPIEEKTVDLPPIEISNEPELYAIILEPSITFYTSVLAETSTEGCSVVSGEILQWLSDGETTTTIVHVECEEGDTAKLNLIDFTYHLGASITLTVKLRILTQEIKLDTWVFTLPEKTVPASDTVTIPLSWNVIPEFSWFAILLVFMLFMIVLGLRLQKWETK